jgi:glycosyltransferase involved in cell wall biosynthesis
VHNPLAALDHLHLKSRIEIGLAVKIYQHAPCVLTVSQALADELTHMYGVPDRRIQTIYNPVLTEALPRLANEPLTHPFFEPGQPPVILSAGRLTVSKDFPTLIRAFSLVRQHRPARLVILGEGEQRPTLESLIAGLGIGADIDLRGFENNPFNYMRQASVFCLSSMYEGFGNVLVKALACGCPVVSTDCPVGPAEILANGAYGDLTPVGDSTALADALLGVLDGRGKVAPPEWLDQFQTDTSVEAYLDLMGIL